MDSVFRDFVIDLQSKISKLDADLHRYINHGYFGPDFNDKEREIKRLREQLDQLNRDHSHPAPPLYVPKPYTQTLMFPSSPPYLSSSRPPDDSQYFKSTGELFRKYPPLSPPKKKKPTKKSSHKQPSSDQYRPALYTSHHSPTSSEPESDSTSTTSSQSSWNTIPDISTPDRDQTDLTQVFMASRTDPQPSVHTYNTPDDASTAPYVEEPQENVSGQPYNAKPTNGPWFNLDDSSPDSWRKKISEMSAWLDLQMAKSEHNLEAILREFVSRFTGSLIDWYQALREYRQL